MPHPLSQTVLDALPPDVARPAVRPRRAPGRGGPPRGRRLPPRPPGHVPRRADEPGQGARLGALRGRRAAARPPHHRDPERPGRAVHAGGQAPRRAPRAAGDRLDRRGAARAGRPAGRARPDGRPAHPDRVADDHRGRLPGQPGHRRVRRRRTPRSRPTSPTGRRPHDGVRLRRRGAGPAARRGHRAVHGAVVRQHPRQRRRGQADDDRVRPAQGRRPGGLDGGRGRLPELHGRPDHAGHLARGHRAAGRRLRCRGRLAGGVRAVHAVGGRGPLRQRPAAARGRRRAGRRRRRAVRADEAAAAQRLAPGDRATSATSPATGTRTRSAPTRCSSTSSSATWSTRAARPCPTVPGVDLDAYRRQLVERFANPEVRDTLARLRRRELGPDPEVARAGDRPQPAHRRRGPAVGPGRRVVGPLRRGHRRAGRADRGGRPDQGPGDGRRRPPGRGPAGVPARPRPVRRPGRRRAVHHRLPATRCGRCTSAAPRPP